MKKKPLKKLEIHRETLRHLNSETLQDVNGAAASHRTVCVCPTLSIGQCVTVMATNCPSIGC